MEIILFGSRARGDWEKESDWDFLMLTDLNVSENLKRDFTIRLANEIEFVIDEAIFVIMKNRKEWEEDCAVTNLYQSIYEEGILI